MSAASGGGTTAAPAWFAPAMDAALKPIKDLLKDLEDKVDDMKTTLDDMKTVLVALTIYTAMNHNRNLRDGKVTAFVPVPFSDGTMPADNDNTNTPLTSASVIAALTRNELLEYCTGYCGNKQYPAGAAGKTQRLADLRDAIGCTVHE
ncbi:hypothetical protein B0H17DRAFT_489599 [Mycena rosella]|uniref:Mug135-like C-terminal domain-containing protein n=1 Tax=Mycena rosella TaxID=1033263 RepID=A0AAD7DK28_MYCRO|nr:hypothetical protein B0H17DRAFT_489599 [Mycena rosella]